jgi:hypothetical protein
MTVNYLCYTTYQYFLCNLIARTVSSYPSKENYRDDSADLVSKKKPPLLSQR